MYSNIPVLPCAAVGICVITVGWRNLARYGPNCSLCFSTIEHDLVYYYQPKYKCTFFAGMAQWARMSQKIFFGLILDCSPLVWCCCVIGHTYMVSMTFAWLCCMCAKAIVVFNYHCNLLTFLNRGYVHSVGLSKKNSDFQKIILLWW